MGSDEGKLFIGGVAWDTTEESLLSHFGQYGEVSEAVIVRDKITQRPRGFAFVIFSDPCVLDRVLQEPHTIDGRTVEVKKALSREDQHSFSRNGNFFASRSSGEGGNYKTKKIFVGGLPSTLTEDKFCQYFENYGRVTDVVIMYDQNTQRTRGFGFITFESENSVDRVLHKTFHELDGKSVEVKRALPKDASPGGISRFGGHQGFNASGANANTFDSHVDRNKYMQPQNTAGGFPTYPTYMPPGFGYGAYGSYGIGGYGSVNSGFGGQAGAYGNPNAQNAGFIGGAPGASKNAWSNQVSGYGASGYGYTAPWTGSAPAISAPRGQSGYSTYQSPGYGYGYGYGYGSNGGSDGSFSTGGAGNAASGISGGEQQEYGSGYGDSHGKSGYASESYPSQATGNYGGGNQYRRA